MAFRTRLLIGGLIFTLGCDAAVVHSNPYDPDNRTGTAADGRITGKVFIEGRIDQSAIVVDVIDDSGGNESATTDADGAFVTAEIPPGHYRVVVQVPAANLPTEVTRVEVLPGLTTDVGLLVSPLAPAEGVITGSVSIDDPTVLPSGVRLLATQERGGVLSSWVTFTDPKGNYTFSEMPAGDFTVQASREGFTPDFKEVTVAASTRATSTVEAMILYPVAVVVSFSVDQDDGTVLENAPYTKRADVGLSLLSFGGVNEVRFSEAPDFIDDGTAVPWRVHDTAIVPVNLSPGEGRKTYYAQFRLVNTADVEFFRTDIYSASIVLDQTPPEPIRFTIGSDLPVLNGVPVAVTDAADPFITVPILLEAVDAYSTVAQVKIVLPGQNPDTVLFTDVTGGNSAIYSDNVTLDNEDGNVTIQGQMRDGAGNSTNLFARTLRIDANPPVALATPALVAVDAVTPTSPSPLYTQHVTLALFVGEDAANGIDGPERMYIGVGSPSTAGVAVPFQPTFDMTISVGNGDSVQFFAVVEDVAGNQLSLQSPIYTVNLEGSVVGSALLQDVDPNTGDHSAILVQILDTAGGVVQEANVLSNGNYTFDSVLQGSYFVRFSAPAYRSATLPLPVTVMAGVPSNIPQQILQWERGSLAGVFRYGNLTPNDNHSGIQVIARRKRNVTDTSYAFEFMAFTDNTGAVNFADLPVTAATTPKYEVIASADGYIDKNVLNVEVLNGQDNSIAAGTPQDLLKLSGQFKLCSQTEFAASGETEPANCRAKVYINEDEVLLGLSADAAVFPYVRYVLDTSGAASIGSFADAASTPTSDPCTAGSVPPEPDCWNDYSNTELYTLPIASVGQDIATVVVQFAQDATDNAQDVGVAQILRDTLAPYNPAIVIDRGDEALLEQHTNSSIVSLSLSADPANGPGPTAPLELVLLSEDTIWGDADDETPFYTDPLPITYSFEDTSDGTKTIYARFCDAAANCTATGSAVSDTIELDTIAPDHSLIDIAPTGLSIAPKNVGLRQWWARSTVYDLSISMGLTSPARQITIGATAYDVPEIGAYRVSASQNFVGAPWVAIDLEAHDAGDIVKTAGVGLAPVQGDQFVYASFKDVAGNVLGDVVETRITLDYDTIPPGGLVSFASNFTNTTAPATIGALLSTDADVTTIQTTDAAGWNGVLPNPVSGATQAIAPGGETIQVAVPAGEGQKTLHVRFFDPAGNFSERAASIILDTTAPTGATAVCVSCTRDGTGALYLPGDGSLTLNVTANDAWGIHHVDIIVDGGSPDTRSFAPALVTAIPNDRGVHTVLVRFVDPAGNFTDAPVLTIRHDDTGPTGCALTIEGTAADGVADQSLTGTQSVSLLPRCTGGADEMMISNSSGFVGASWQPYSEAALPWTLEPGDSTTKTVYIRYRDWAGNTVTGVTGQIELDTTPPSAPSLVLAANATYTNAAPPNHTISASVTANGADEMKLDVDGSFDNDAWEAVGTSSVNLPTGDGLKTVYAIVRDDAGNEASFVSSAQIILDTLGPQVLDVTVGNGSGFVTASSGNVNVAANCADAQASDGELSLLLEDEVGNVLYDNDYFDLVTVSLLGVESSGRNITATCTDAIGNGGSSTSADFIWDYTPPTATTFTLNGGASSEPTNAPIISVHLAFDDAVSGGAVGAIADQSFTCSAAAFVHSGTGSTVDIPFSLSPGEGLRSMYLCMRDVAGNVTPTAITSSNAILLDTIGPGIPSLVRTSITNATIDLQWSIPAGTDHFILERRLRNEGAFTVVDIPGGGASTFTDNVSSSNLGVGHLYRIAAFDAVGNSSGYSIELDAGTPIEPVSATYLRTPVERGVSWSNPKGTFLSIGTYSYRDLDNTLFETPIATNTVLFTLPLPSGSLRFNEKLVVRNSNADSSLTWESEFFFGNVATVIDESTSCYSPVIAIDDSGVGHMVYYCSPDMRYVTLDGSSPITLETTSAGDPGMYPSIVIDDNGDPLVTYVVESSTELHFVRVNGANTVRVIDTSVPSWFEDGHSHTSMAVDSNGTPHVCYYRSSDSALIHTAITAGCESNPASCVHDQVDGAVDDVGTSCSLAIDAADNVRIAYYDGTTFDLKYTTVGGTPITVDSTGFVGQHASLAIDRNGLSRIVYFDQSNSSLKYVEITGACLAGTCSPTTLDDAGFVGEFASIAVDSANTAHIVYYDATNGDLKYILYDSSCQADLPNCPQVLVRSGDSGYHSFITLDQADTPNIGYANVTDRSIVWLKLDIMKDPVVVDSTNSGFNLDGDVAMGPDGAPQVCYYGDGRNPYHVKLDGYDTPTVLESSARDYGRSCSIAVDTTGAAHILYFDQTGKDLKYAVVGAGLIAPIVFDGSDTTAFTGRYNDIAIDATGTPVAIYRKGSFGSQPMLRANITSGCLSDLPNCPSSIGVTDDGPMVVHFDDTGTGHLTFSDGGLKYLKLDGSSSPVPIYDVSSPLWHDMDIDSNGDPHVVVQRPSTKNLEYVHVDAACQADVGACAPIVLDDAGSVGLPAAVAVDGEDRAHVAYRDFANLDLKYVLVQEGALPQRLEIADDVGSDPSIAVGPGNVLHVVHDDRTNDELHYVTGRFATPLMPTRVDLVQ